jgi:surface carbohydrate biosynthesis protein
MKPPEVLYCIEHVARELDTACAARATARKKYGTNVHIHVLSNDLDQAFERRAPRLIVVPYCTSRKLSPSDIFQRWPDAPVVNVACEQLFSLGNRRFRLPKDHFARNEVLHVAAGDFFREWLLESGVAPENILLVGSMAYQMYREPYRQFFEARRATFAAAYDLDPNLPWVLFPENFGAAFFSRSHIRQRIRGGYDRDELAAYVDYSRRSFCEIATWCSEAAAAGNVELIIRPRPAIARDLFVQTFHDVSGSRPTRHLHFIKDGNVQEWIQASQMVVSSYSTTLLEAAVAGKPAYLLAPFPPPETAASDWHKFAPSISSQAAFLELTGSAANATPDDRLRQWADRNLLDHGDAVHNVARVIHEICSGLRTAPTPRGPTLPRAAAGTILNALRQPERFFRHRLRPQRRRVFGHECDVIGREAIDQRTDQWDTLLTDDARTRVA